MAFAMGKRTPKSRNKSTKSLKPAKGVKLRFPTKREYAFTRQMLTKACLAYTKESDLEGAEAKNVKRVLKSMFTNVFQQVERDFQIGGREASRMSKAERAEKAATLERLRTEVPDKVQQGAFSPESPSDRADSKASMPSKDSFESAVETANAIDAELKKIADILPGYQKGATNLLKYIKSATISDDIDVEELLDSFASATAAGSGSSRTPRNRKGKQMDRIAQSLRTGRWR